MPVVNVSQKIDISWNAVLRITLLNANSKCLSNERDFLVHLCNVFPSRDFLMHKKST